MNFQIGEKVVYPNQGVGTVDNISIRCCGSALEKFYLLRFTCTNAIVFVPYSHAADSGLRRVTKDREISRVLSYLANGDCPVTPDWKLRFRENTSKMQSGDLLKAAEVFKSLARLSVDKPLAFRERKMQDQALRMLVSEISSVREMPEAQAAATLQKALLAAGLTLPPAR